MSYCAALGNLKRLKKSRDLSLPAWGPYAREHFALSHITDQMRGTLFECLVIPGIAGGQKYFPHKRACFRYVPIDANADLSFYAMRCNMDHGTHADLRFYGDARDVRLSETVFTNCRKRPINFRLDYALGFQFEGEGVQVVLKEDESFLAAHRYDELNLRLPQTCMDQKPEGTTASPMFIQRLALGPAFTSKRGASANYHWDLRQDLKNGKLGIRYALSGAKEIEVRVSFAGKSNLLRLKPTGDTLSFDALRIHWRKITSLPSGRYNLCLSMVSPSASGELHLDGFFLVSQRADLIGEGRLRRIEATPALVRHVEKDFLAIRSPLARGKVYGVMVRAKPEIRAWTLKASNMFLHNVTSQFRPRFALRDTTIDHGNEHVFGDLRPLVCRGSGTVCIRAAVGFARSVSALKAKLSDALRNWNGTTRRIMARHAKTAFRIRNRECRQGIEGVMAAALTTVSFPQDFGNEYVRHLTPGAFYPTLYQWDAGMQGLGLMEYSPKLSLEGLNAYLCLEEEPGSLVLHGTVLPTQMFQYWELFQRTGDIGMLKALYPKMRRYYRFMAGKDGSLMDRFGSGLICPWDYFYNSGGWDDYPPQVYVGRNSLGKAVSPVVNTAYTIRCAKIMAMAALELDRRDDAGEYLNDADRMMRALLEYSWDEKSGYFSYVIDKGKRKLEFKPGMNFNMGLDGVSPVVAGLKDEQILKKLVKHCKNPKRLWTRLGLSTVDQSAPYYEDGGYHNGAVWVPHQWFIFKGLLDCCRPAFALKLAGAVVTAYCRAVEENRGQVLEGIEINTGRSCGTPYFSALSLPVVSLYMACFEPGRLTTGFDTLVKDIRFDSRRRRLSSIVSNPLRPGKTGFVATTGKAGRYACRLGSVTRDIEADRDGRLAFNVSVSRTPALLEIAPVGQGRTRK